MRAGIALDPDYMVVTLIDGDQVTHSFFEDKFWYDRLKRLDVLVAKHDLKKIYVDATGTMEMIYKLLCNKYGQNLVKAWYYSVDANMILMALVNKRVPKLDLPDDTAAELAAVKKVPFPSGNKCQFIGITPAVRSLAMGCLA